MEELWLQMDPDCELLILITVKRVSCDSNVIMEVLQSERQKAAQNEGSPLCWRRKGGELREWSTRKGRKQILLEHSAVDTLTLVK